MSTKRRLQKLEAATDTPQDVDLWLAVMDILGRVEALFAPFRVGSGLGGEPLALIERRREYRRRGLPWAGTVTDRMAAMRQRQALKSAGLIEVSTGCVRGSVFVRLPLWVEHRARLRAELPTLLGARYYYRLLPLLYDPAPYGPDVGADWGWCRNGGWVSEWLLFRREGERRARLEDIADHQYRITPALVAGAIESTTSGMAEMFYRVGKRPLPEPPHDDTVSTDDDDPLLFAFVDGWNEVLGQRRTWRAVDRNEVFIHQSASR